MGEVEVDCEDDCALRRRMTLDDGRVKEMTEVDERRMVMTPKIQLLSFIGSIIGWRFFSLIGMMGKKICRCQRKIQDQVKGDMCKI